MKTIAQQLNITDFPFIINDTTGNRIYFEDSNGAWIKQEYNTNGYRIYYKDSNGYWYKREYNSKGNLIYHERSDGSWCKKEYDSNGNEIYYENSKGKIRDNRPKQSCDGKIVEIEGKKYKLTSI